MTPASAISRGGGLGREGWRQAYFAYLPASRDDAFVRAMVDGLARYVDLGDRARVLDFGCGTGAQTLEIARRGCRVLGVDSDLPRLSEARSGSDKTLWVHFISKDMRRIGYEAEFHVAVNLHHPLGRGEEHDERCLAAVHRALKPKGRLVLDLPSRDWLVRRIDPGSGERALLDAKTGRFQAGEAPGLRVYCLSELVRLLERARFAVRAIHGGWEGEPFGFDAMRMIVVAEKVTVAEKARKEDDLPRAIRIKGRGR